MPSAGATRSDDLDIVRAQRGELFEVARVDGGLPAQNVSAAISLGDGTMTSNRVHCYRVRDVGTAQGQL